MSGTTSSIPAPAGFFLNDQVTPATATDLQSAVNAATTNIDAALAAEAGASASATAAAASALSASGSANSAASSATSASSSDSSASSSATAAASSASSAATQANNANTSANNASSSATAAAGSATSASSSATAASNSATNAATSASGASTSATNAGNSATQAAASATNAATSASQAANSAAIQGANTGRNLLHNGQFRIQQRGGGPFSASGYTVDRWKLGFSTTGGACSVAPNPYSAALASQGMSDERAESVFTYITTAGSQGAGDFSTLGQNIEDARRLSGQTVTLSFWAWANIAGTKLGVEFVQNFGTGGSPSAQITGIGAQAVTLANTPTRYAITVSIPSAVGRTFGTAGGDFTQILFWLSSGSTNASRASNIGFQSGTFNFWGVQLEYGSVATPLEVRDPQIEVALCQRFYQVLAGFQASGYAPSAGATPGSPIILPVMMRVTPTVAVTNTAFSAASAVSIFPQTGSTATTILTATAGPTVAWATFNAAFSADL